LEVRALAGGDLAALVELWGIRAETLVYLGAHHAARLQIDQVSAAVRSGMQEFEGRSAELEGIFLLRRGSVGTSEYFRSVDLFERAIADFQSRDDFIGQIRATEGLMSAKSAVGNYIAAIKVADEGLALCHARDDWRYAHRLLIGRALAFRDQGYRQPAESAFELALEWCEYVEDRRNLAWALTHYGTLLRYMVGVHREGRYVEALTALNRAVELAHGLNSPVYVADAHAALAELHLEAGDPDLADLERNRALDPHSTLATATARAAAVREQNASIIESQRQEKKERRMREAIESSPQAMIVFDRLVGTDGQTLDFLNVARNSMAERLLGADQRLHLSELENCVFHSLTAAFERVVVDGIPYEDEVWCGEDGSRRCYARRVVPTTDGVAASFSDVTDAKNVRAALEAAAEQAREADRAKTEFLANVTHEVRTPLNGVLGLARLLSDTPLEPQQRAYIDGVISSADILLGVIGDVLDLSKIEAGRFDLDPQPTATRELLESSAQLFAGQAQQRGLKLRVEIEPNFPPTLLLDGTRVRQVLANLVGNAVKFTPEGEVVIRGSHYGGLFRVEVSDTGVGIPEHLRDRVFEAFRQVDGTGSAHGGTGLGLSISRRLAQLMNGTLELQSVIGEGSTFRLELPAQEVATRGIEVGSEAPSLNGVRVLLAEDNEVNVLVACGLLEKLGCQIDVASDGREALAMSASGHYGVILMDVRMPNMDGLAATRAIRASEIRTPIVALTAGALADERSDCFAAGMDGFLGKPFTEEALRDVIAQWAGRAL